MADNRKYIEILFSCALCGLKDIPVKVRARPSPAEDVKYYVERVIGSAVQQEHQLRSFGCEAKKLKEIKIPLSPDDDPQPWIGKYNSRSTFRKKPKDA